MNVSSMNVLLIGLGRWGEKHLRVLRQLGITLWVADVSSPRLEWAVRNGVDADRAVTDYRTALAHVEAVDIVTPADSHSAVAQACLAAGLGCFIEKPLACTVEEGRALDAAARAAGRIIQVGHIFRFHPVTATLREALRDELVGPIRYATGRFSGFKRPRLDVGVTQTDAIHYFDLFAHLFGCEASQVSALQRDYLGRGLDDASWTVVHYCDIPTVIEANYFVPGTWRECVIVGERGALVADYGASTVTLHRGVHLDHGGTWEALDSGKEELPTGRDEPLRLELQAFLDACRGQGPNLVPAADGVRALAIVEAAARAAQLGRTVQL
jgi:UDP-N-acetylglucosamine 3-dehydrogenase